MRVETANCTFLIICIYHATLKSWGTGGLQNLCTIEDTHFTMILYSKNQNFAQFLMSLLHNYLKRFCTGICKDFAQLFAKIKHNYLTNFSRS